MKRLRNKLLLGLCLAALMVSFISIPSLQGVGGRNEEPVRFSPDDSLKATQSKIEKMREEIRMNGDTFEIGINPAMQYSLDQLCVLNSGSELAAANASVSNIDDITPIAILPASYTGYYTSVKNQGSCGAWAYVTCGVFEGAIKKFDSVTVDLSEQWLIDCNTLGYTCAAGWFAHDMHVNPGAVLGSDYIPGDCVGPYNHPYILQSWAYVGNSSSVPSTTAIKQAIYNYGSVAALVYVDSYFQAYTSGCFSRNAAGRPNHFIILVGWNNSQCTTGAWYLKNSWGTGWGQSGFMWIKYGVQSVGYAANYVVY